MRKSPYVNLLDIEQQTILISLESHIYIACIYELFMYITRRNLVTFLIYSFMPQGYRTGAQPLSKVMTSQAHPGRGPPADDTSFSNKPYM